MSRSSDSDVDLAKYMPTVEASLRLADHDAAEERIRRALEDPELQAVLAAEGRSVEFTPVPPAPPKPATAPAEGDDAAGRARALARHDTGVIDPRSIAKVRRMADAADAAKAVEPSAPKRPSAPSPWVAPAVEIDEAALPSATVRPVPDKRPRGSERQAGERRLPMWTIWTAAGTIVAVLGVLLLARSLGPHPKDVPVPATGTAGPTATGGPSAKLPAATSGSSDAAPAPPATSVSPSATPSADPAPPVSATAAATTGAAVPPTARPSGAVPKPRHSGDDPGDPPPSPPQAPTAASAVPSATPVAPPTSPASATSPKPRDPFLLEKKDE